MNEICLKLSILIMNTQKSETDVPFKIIGDWLPQAERLKERYPELTEADLKFEIGKESELLDRIGTRLNKGRQDVISMISQVQAERVSY